LICANAISPITNRSFLVSYVRAREKSTMSDILYVNSTEFDYSKAINPDCGPLYANDLDVRCTVLGKCDWSVENRLYLLDPRLSVSELNDIEQIAADRSVSLAMRFVDPYFPPQRTWTLAEWPTARFALRMCQRKSFGVVSTYPAQSMTECIREAVGAARFHTSPYPYNSEHEIAIESGRIGKVIISGKLSPDLYPLRCFAATKRSRSFTWRLKSSLLKHPGYPDVTGIPAQGLTGVDYLKHLSQFQLMFVCPGIYEFEYLKYRECAYAGCCPVGGIPKGLPDIAADAVIQFSWKNFRESLNAVTRPTEEELAARASKFRSSFRSARDPQTLREALLSWADGLIHSAQGKH
jgi:hypothetical protein